MNKPSKSRILYILKLAIPEYDRAAERALALF